MLSLYSALNRHMCTCVHAHTQTCCGGLKETGPHILIYLKAWFVVGGAALED